MVSGTRWLALVTCAVFVVTMTAVGAARPVAREAQTRVIYVTAVDSKGAPVLDLTAADLNLKEGGKSRDIVNVAPASERLQATILLQLSLSALDGVHLGLAKLMQQILPQADISLSTAGLTNVTLADRSHDPEVLVNAIGQLGVAPHVTEEHILDGIADVARGLQALHVGRSAIVVIAIGGPQTTVTQPDQVLDQIARSGAVMYAATIDNGASGVPSATGGATNGRPVIARGGGAGADAAALDDESAVDHVLGDGPRQSGGRRQEITMTGTALAAMLEQFGKELAHQYAVTYTVPDGVKLDSHLSVSIKRKNVTLHAPTRIPD